MAEIIRKPAVKIVQEQRTLYSAAFVAKDFLRGESFCCVDELDVAMPGKGGFQRILEEGRAKKLANDLVGAAAEEEAFLPTSILLATQGDIDYDDVAKEIVFSTDPGVGICPFNVVDGQHRISGLCQFVEAKPEMANFPVFVNIAAGLDKARQMLHFLTVNTKQKKVDTGLAQHITAKFSRMKGYEHLPYLPSWLKHTVAEEYDLHAGEVVAYLSDEADSPWHGKIKRTNHPKEPGHTVNDHAFTKSVKSYILPNSQLKDLDREERKRVLKNYWRAVAGFFVTEGVPTIVFKTNGMDFFHMVSAAVIRRCRDLGHDYKVDTIKGIFRQAHEHIDDVYSDCLLPQWWESGNTDGAAVINKGGITKYAHGLSKAIERSSIVPSGGIKT